MEKGKINSLKAHVVTFLIASIGVCVISFFTSFDSVMSNLAVGYGSIYLFLTIIFCVFAVPIERDRLRKSDWRYRWLNLDSSYEDDLGNSINICHLPGLIARAVAISVIVLIFFPIIIVIVLAISNIVRPIVDGRYVVFNRKYDDFLQTRKISWHPEIHIGGENGPILRLWMILLFGVVSLILWNLVLSIPYCSLSVEKVSASLPYAVIITTAVLVIYFFAKWQVWRSLGNLIKAFDEKFCINGKIIDE